MTNIKETLERLLNELGSSHQEVAESLQKKGVRGLIRSKCGCPLANYLSTMTDQIYHIDTMAVRNEAGLIMLLTPLPCKDFIIGLMIMNTQD